MSSSAAAASPSDSKKKEEIPRSTQFREPTAYEEEQAVKELKIGDPVILIRPDAPPRYRHFRAVIGDVKGEMLTAKLLRTEDPVVLNNATGSRNFMCLGTPEHLALPGARVLSSSMSLMRWNELYRQQDLMSVAKWDELYQQRQIRFQLPSEAAAVASVPAFKRITQNDMRVLGMFCDCVIQSNDGQSFMAHRNVLGTSSSVFRLAFQLLESASHQKMVNPNYAIGGWASVSVVRMNGGEIPVPPNSYALFVPALDGSSAATLSRVLSESSGLGLPVFTKTATSHAAPPPQDLDCDICLHIASDPVRFCGDCKRRVCRACADAWMTTPQYQNNNKPCFWCRTPNAPPYFVDGGSSSASAAATIPVPKPAAAASASVSSASTASPSPVPKPATICASAASASVSASDASSASAPPASDSTGKRFVVNTIKLDYSSEVVSELLQAIYTDEKPISGEFVTVRNLLHAAQQYQVPSVFERCCKRLSEMISPISLAHILWDLAQCNWAGPDTVAGSVSDSCIDKINIALSLLESKALAFISTNPHFAASVIVGSMRETQNLLDITSLKRPNSVVSSSEDATEGSADPEIIDPKAEKGPPKSKRLRQQ